MSVLLQSDLAAETLCLNLSCILDTENLQLCLQTCCLCYSSTLRCPGKRHKGQTCQTIDMEEDRQEEKNQLQGIMQALNVYTCILEVRSSMKLILDSYHFFYFKSFVESKQENHCDSIHYLVLIISNSINSLDFQCTCLKSL